MRFLLAVGAACALLSSAAIAATEEPADLDKVRCKRFAEIGSLVKTRKVCKTGREWLKWQISVREQVDRLQHGRMSDPQQ